MLCEGISLQNLLGISFQNLLGISLLLGDMNSSFPGETRLDSSGDVLNYVGEAIPLNADIPPGNNLYTKTAGDAC